MAITLQDIDNMPSAEYKQKLNDPAFLSEVEALLKSPAAVAPVAQPQEVEVDPSMPTRTQVPTTSVRERLAEPVVAPIAPGVAPIAPIVAPIAPVALVVLPELTYEYQPMDEYNRPMGGKQVIKYQTPDELAQKLSEQNTLLIRKLRQVTRENRLGTPAATIPADAAHYVATELKAKELTTDERFQITQDLNDPEKFASARDRLLESAVGIPPAELRQRLNDQQMTILQLRAKENFLTFAQKQDFLTGHGVTDSENAQTLTDWMFKNTLAPTVENFELASSQLRSAGLLNEAPVVQQVPVPQPLSVVPGIGR